MTTATSPSDHAPPSPSRRLRLWLAEPISIQSLVVVRVAFGLILLWDWWRYVRYDRIVRYYVESGTTFPFIPGVQPLPEPWIHILWGGVGLFGLLVAAGAFYRVSIVALTGIFAYFFLLDRAQYLNHNYMVILFGVLLAMAPAHRAWSVDAWLRPDLRSATIPRWPVTAIKAQLEIILIFAGLVKITDDWLRGEPLRTWLSGREDEVFFGFLFQYDGAFAAAAIATILLHVLGAPLLLWHRTRLAVFCIYAVFHWSNAQLFNIGIFPWITLALTTIFFAPDWPSRLVGRPAPSPVPRPGVRPIPTALVTFLAAWMAVQIALPLRQAVFPGLVGWTGEGHRFSWRMRIYDRDRRGHFRIISADGTEELILDPYDYFSARQARNILARPDIAVAFVRQMEANLAREGIVGVRIYAEVEVALNGRPYQPLYDPEIDLTQVNWDRLSASDWILPNRLRAPAGDLPEGWPWLPLQGSNLPTQPSE